MNVPFPRDLWFDRWNLPSEVDGESAHLPSGHANHSPLLPGPWYAHVGQKLHPPAENLAIHLPEYHEPNYAYPLLIWLHGLGGNERDLWSMMPNLSTRNYIGLSLRGNVRTRRGGYGWETNSSAVATVFERMTEAVMRLAEQFYLHPERVLLIGFDQGGTMALELMQYEPECFSGAIALAPRLTEFDAAASVGDLANKRVLLGVGSRDVRVSSHQLCETAEQLESAGASVTRRLYDAGHQLTPAMLRDVNVWVMEGFGAVV